MLLLAAVLGLHLEGEARSRCLLADHFQAFVLSRKSFHCLNSIKALKGQGKRKDGSRL